MSKRKASKAILSQPDTKRPDVKPTCTIAIDFGTAGTGYAYCFAGSDVIEAKQPGGQDARKTLTNILLNDDESFAAFGYDARRQYSETGKGLFFSNYKMLLSNVDGAAGETMAQALNGKRVRLMDVISKTITYVKDEALKECGRALPNGIRANECQWVLTIPAIWSDKAKGFMRKAAYQAGLIEEQDSRRLLLALEPESAAICCDIGQLVTAGQTFMVLDTGGGTVDITMNRLQSSSPLRLHEVQAPSGGPWGSTFVDNRFEEFVGDLVGQKSFDALKATAYWIELLENWENVKTSQTADESTRTLNFSPTLEVLDDGVKLADLVDTYNTTHGASLKMRGRSTIVMDAAFARRFFKNTMEKIVTHCEHLLGSDPVNHIFLVGGFAESELLQSLIKSRFDSPRCKVIVPVRPSLAVLRGAVLFGVNQDVFASRVARFTYGFCQSEPYNAALPLHSIASPIVRETYDGRKVPYVDDIFLPLVKVGDKLPAGHTASRSGYRTFAKNQSKMAFQIFSTPLGSINFTTDNSARQIGTATINCNQHQSAEIKLEFGATEISARAYNESTGEQVQVQLRYD